MVLLLTDEEKAKHKSELIKSFVKQRKKMDDTRPVLLQIIFVPCSSGKHREQKALISPNLRQIQIWIPLVR